MDESLQEGVEITNSGLHFLKKTVPSLSGLLLENH